MNLNLVKLNNNNNNNIGIYDQTMNKYSMKFFEKLNMNNNKNNKGIKYSNINELTNTINKNKLNNIKKDAIQIYNKEKNKNKIIPKQKEKNKFINDKFEENLAIKAVEEQLLKEIRQKKDDIYKMDKLDKIENIKFDIDRAEFFQCGICMDSFQDGEQLKKLSCLHLYHKDCLNQWIQTKKDCPLCGKFINI